MKLIMLAGALALAAPAFAQTQTTPPADAAADSAMPAAAPAPAPAADGATADPVGGYQPASPPMASPPPPGAQVVFKPAPSPDQAYPAPAPMAKYPACKKGQYDNCMQRGGK